MRTLFFLLLSLMGVPGGETTNPTTDAGNSWDPNG